MVLNRWRNVCPSCFDAEAERAGVRYQFVDVGADVVEQRARAGSPVRQEATLARVVCTPPSLFDTCPQSAPPHCVILPGQSPHVAIHHA